MHGYINVVVYKTEFWERCAPPLGIGEVHTSPKKPPHSLTISPKSGLGYMLTRFLHACHLISYLYFKVQMVTVAMHVSLVLENVIIRIEIIVFRDFMTLVK